MVPQPTAQTAEQTAEQPTEQTAEQTTEQTAEPTAPRTAGSLEAGGTRPPVEFITNVRYLSPNRPDWLESPPEEDQGVYRVTVKAGPYPSVRDCEADLEREVRLAVDEFTNDHLQAAHASQFVHFSLRELRSRKVVHEQFSEQLETSLGLMNQVHAKLVFDDTFRDELEERWSAIKSKSRLAQTGIGSAIVLLFLATMFGFLKVDTATKGYYTGRLQLAASAAILALVAASVLLMSWIPWM